MESAVSKALDSRGDVTGLKTISLDEKAFSEGHNYATILVDSQKDCVIELGEGRAKRRKSVTLRHHL
jgi:hypothetical protein